MEFLVTVSLLVEQTQRYFNLKKDQRKRSEEDVKLEQQVRYLQQEDLQWGAPHTPSSMGIPAWAKPITTSTKVDMNGTLWWLLDYLQRNFSLDVCFVTH